MSEPGAVTEEVPTNLKGAEIHGYYITPQLDISEEELRCVNDEAIWSLSTARPGNGIPQLLSENVRFAPFFVPVALSPLEINEPSHTRLFTLPSYTVGRVLAV